MRDPVALAEIRHNSGREPTEEEIEDKRRWAVEEMRLQLLREVTHEVAHDAVDGDWPRSWNLIVQAWKRYDLVEIGRIVDDAIHQHVLEVARHNVDERDY